MQRIKSSTLMQTFKKLFFFGEGTSGAGDWILCQQAGSTVLLK